MSVGKRISLEDFIKKEGTCWIWKGVYRADNCPIYITRGKARDARKVCFEKHVTEIDSATLEPKCKDPRCIRPDHQKVITK